MKKKIAVFMAALMALSPISAFAATDNQLTTTANSVLGKTIFMETGWGGTGYNLKANNASNNEIEYMVTGPTLDIKLTNGSIREGDTFKLGLDNAKWFFRHSNGGSIKTTPANDTSLVKFLQAYGEIEATEFDAATGDATKAIIKYSSSGIPASLISEIENMYIDGTKLIDTVFLGTTAGSLGLNDGTGSATALKNIKLNDGTLGLPTVAGSNIITLFPASAVAVPTANQDTRGRADFTDSNLLSDIYANSKIAGVFKGTDTNEITTYNPTGGIYFPQSQTYLRLSTTAVSGADYFMMISNADDSIATVRITEDVDTSVTPVRTLKFPLTTLSKEEGDVRVRIEDTGNSSITEKVLRYGLTTKSSTKTTVKTPVTAKYTFPIDQLIIQETVPGTLKQGQAYLHAPYGFAFSDPRTKPNNGNYPQAFASEGLFFRNNETVATNTSPNTFLYFDKKSDGSDNREILVIDTAALGISPSMSTNGKLTIEGLSLVADDYSPDGPVIMEIKDSYNQSNKTNITEENVKVGDKNDWEVKMTTTTTVPNLVSGRYFDELSGRNFDTAHKTASVKFEENIVASWWSLRETEFYLPEEVKFRKVVIKEEKNFDHSGTRFAGLNGTYYPSGTKQDYVSLGASSMKFADLSIKRDQTSSFEMDIWVSIRADFDEAIELGVRGNDILDSTKPITIAKAFTPVKIETKITDVKIGYQWQQVADIYITETAFNALASNTRMEIRIDDGITANDNIYFAPDFITALNEGSKTTITRPAITNGRITFNIDRQSYDKPTTIRFTNVYVKIDRTVPETNKRPYKIVAGGDAIAANYRVNYNNYEPFFSISGIGEDYLEVVTPAENTGGSTLKTQVKVKIGDPNIVMGTGDGEKTIDMGTSAYISTASNSTMVPVRFVSQALGIPESQVDWDREKRVATIFTGSVILQFTAGSSELIINGVTKTMYSADNPPLKVFVEIRDERAFLPFRELGNALGVTVFWDEPNGTAVYNPREDYGQETQAEKEERERKEREEKEKEEKEKEEKEKDKNGDGFSPMP